MLEKFNMSTLIRILSDQLLLIHLTDPEPMVL